MNKQTEALKMAASVISSINEGKQHLIITDDDRGFFQREEWVRWAIDEVLPQIKEALEQPAQGIELEWYQKGWDDAKREGISKTETTTATIKESLNVEPAQEPVAWECFSDPAYYDMWAIRQVGNRNFEETIHVVNGKEAKQLCAWLNSLNIHTCVLTHSAPSFIGLSDDEVKIIQGGFCNGQYYVPDLVRAIEQALKEKNTWIDF